MQELKCPKCGTTFKVDESDYESILIQVRNHEFEKELQEREELLKKEKETAIKLAENNIEKKLTEELNKKELTIQELENRMSKEKSDTEKSIILKENEIEKKYRDVLTEKDLEIQELKQELKLQEKNKELAINNAINEKEKDISNLKTKLESDKSEYIIKENSLKESYEKQIKDKDELISYYRDLKARESTKMIGEDLEQHCFNEFNTLRPLMGNAYFEKDNDARTGSKGDFIFRDYDEDNTEVVSIMFENTFFRVSFVIFLHDMWLIGFFLPL